MNNNNNNNNNRIAIYAGSFDPYTNGHHDIVKKGCEIFDKVIILIAKNTKKQRTYNISNIAFAIERTLENENILNCEVIVFDGLVADYCKQHHIKYSIRGLRNSMDFEYEENISKINKLIYPDMDTIYLRAENVEISSSMVKELNEYEQDISRFVPEQIMKIIYRKN